ncbi:MAG: NAD(P)/FAD-dependent oxidoreductase, partial [Paracoccaceae bacterium]
MAAPAHRSYDVVIVGGAMMGSAVAWFLAKNAQFQGRIVIVEPDPGLRRASTAHSNSCMRQQFSSPLNVKISQFCAAFIGDFVDAIGAPGTPAIAVQNFGYLYLADSDGTATTLRQNQKMQAALGAGTQILMPDQLAARFPFFNLDGIRLGSLNTVDEGYFDGFTMFEHLRRDAQRAGAQFVHDEVVGVNRERDRVTGVVLKSGATIGCAVLVNAAGPRCAQVAAMAGLSLPVEPRRRYTFVFDAQTPLEQDLPLTVDPSGVHVRSDGQYYMAGAAPEPDPAVDPTD